VSRSDPTTLLDELVEAAREARREGLVVSTSGNISARVDEDRVVISAARSRLGQLRREDLLIVDLKDGSVLECRDASSRPSRETPLHLAVYRSLESVRSVLHFQSLAATVFACRQRPPTDFNFIPEVPVYLRRVEAVPFFPPGSAELAGAVTAALTTEDARVVQLCGHGQVAVGEDPRQVVERGAFFELACRMALLSETREPLRRYSRRELEILNAY
jgi:L-fuculose-phosphate aldolase